MEKAIFKMGKSITNKNERYKIHCFFFFQLLFTPCNAEQPQRGMELQEKEAQKG